MPDMEMLLVIAIVILSYVIGYCLSIVGYTILYGTDRQNEMANVDFALGYSLIWPIFWSMILLIIVVLTIADVVRTVCKSDIRKPLYCLADIGNRIHIYFACRGK